VVVGYAPSVFNYNNLNTAFRILVGEGGDRRSSSKPAIPLIATHKAKYLASSSGELSLGPGPFVAALENATGLTAEVVGKPTRRFFETVIGNFGSDELAARGSESGRIAVIGDDIEADLGEGAIELGLWRVLGERATSFLSCNTDPP
jgi:ribonucleotide monophosphatase NagD (HAD superfamily)